MPLVMFNNEDPSSAFLQYIQYLMMISGFLPVRLVKSHKLLYNIYRYFSRICLLVFLFFSFLATPDFNAPREKVFQYFNDRIMFIVMYVKALLTVSNNLEKLIFEMIANEAKISVSGDEKVLKSYQETAKKSKALQLFYMTSVSICYSAVIVPHFITYVEVEAAEGKHNSTLNIYRTKPYDWWVPFEEDKHYLAVLLLQSYFGLLGGCVYCCVQIILINLLLSVTLRLKVLGIRLRSTDVNGGHSINELIEEHTDIVRNCEFLKDTVKSVMLTEFVLVNMQLSMTIFQGITSNDLNVKIFAVAYSIQLLSQILILYWHADQMRVEVIKPDEPKTFYVYICIDREKQNIKEYRAVLLVLVRSVAIADAVYEMPWYEYNRSTATTLRMMMMRAQKPLTLTLGPFGTMTLNVAVKIIKGSYTYVTFMQQTYGNLD